MVVIEMKASDLGMFVLGVAAGAAVGLVVAPEGPQRWKRKVRSSVSRGREAVAVLREAAAVFQEFRQLIRPLDADPESGGMESGDMGPADESSATLTG